MDSNFKMRFYLSGFDGTGESASLDNIGILVTNAAITAKPADTTVNFTITRDDGTVSSVTTPLTADPNDPNQVQSQVKDPLLTPNDGYYYGCRVDVTNLIRNYSDGANLSHTPNPIYGIGNGIYDVAGVYADSLKADGVTYGSASFAGWSLVIIYSSTNSLGHQLYLYDLKNTFRSVPASPANTQTQQITGFIVPQPVGAETEAARLTIFVGEGDIQITGDYVAIVDQRDPTEHYLWDGVDLPSPYDTSNTQASPFNVWNGRSTGSTASQAGIDVDTFTVPVVLLTTLTAALATGFVTASKVLLRNDVHQTALNLAEYEMEWVKTQPYQETTNPLYGVSPFGGVTGNVTGTPIPSPQNGIYSATITATVGTDTTAFNPSASPPQGRDMKLQKITVQIFKNGSLIYSLDGYKVE